jgi:hypothetical protein
MSQARGHWYLLTGFILGIGLGLLIAWQLFPVQYQAGLPASLRADFKDEYRYMIAASYAATGNLGRARARLALLKDGNDIQALGDQSERMLANNAAPSVVRSLSVLSDALKADTGPTTIAVSPESSSVAAQDTAGPATSTPETVSATETTFPAESETPTLESPGTAAATPSPLPTSAVTVAPRPTFTATFTPGPPFNLANKPVTFCEPTQPGLLQVSLKDSNDQPIAGIELVITWAGGEGHFFSGLKPELGYGYADFVLSANVEYALSLSNGNTRVTGLIAPTCTAKDGSQYIGGIHLDFKQP